MDKNLKDNLLKVNLYSRLIVISIMLLVFTFFSPVGNYEYVNDLRCNFSVFGSLHKATENKWYVIYSMIENSILFGITYLFFVRSINKERSIKKLYKKSK